MDTKPKQQRFSEFRRKKQEKLDKDENRLNKINAAIQLFLKDQNVTPFIYAEQEHNLTQIQKRFHDLCKMSALEERELVSVTILNGNSPNEVYLMRKMDTEEHKRFQNVLKEEYTTVNEYDLVYCLKSGYICMAFSTTMSWQRCQILKLYENHQCNVLLLDVGIIERVNWTDLRMINEKYVMHKPIALRCSLANVKTTQPIDRYSLQKRQEFLNILQNQQHDFYIFVNRSNSMSSDIFLYYKVDNQFVCVNKLFTSIESVSENSSASEITSVSEPNSMGTKSEPNSIQMEQSLSSPSDKGQHSIRMKSLSSTPSDQVVQPIQIERSGEPSKMAIEQSPKSSDKLIDSCKITKPWGVLVKYVVGIDEIYVRFTKYTAAYNQLRFKIKMSTECEPKKNKSGWMIGEYCLAIDPDDTSGDWLRGKIVAMNSFNSGFVFLRDIGKTIECKLANLRIINSELNRPRDFTWKIRLASIELAKDLPSNSDPNQLLRNIIDSFEELAFSALKDFNENDQGAILWGIKTTCSALSPDKIEYVNINEELVESGVATTTKSFDGIMSVINPAQEHPSEEDTMKTIGEAFRIDDMHFDKINGNLPMLQGNDEMWQVTDKRTEVTAWLPSEKYPKKNFVAFPMYVSQKCNIFVLEANRKTTADRIEKMLMQKYCGRQLERRVSIEWKKEDACFARYGERFYRATIRRVNFGKNLCVVRFIDYGNCEQLSLDDLRKPTMFGDIPSLAHQYQLHNIELTTWPDHVRDYCNQLVLDKHCDLTVIEADRNADAQGTSEVEYCKLDLLNKHKDLATALIKCGYARLIN
ncbi:uncharacterized protein LOC116345129 [Contarinia nasturtii]|uniref:uncharacterized protein LOC116345129 n=1 Tax=Contarinia nasturtii TaxID=265458 RepID=UPI0012D469E6|nr:uncharacterized protein LOC116345129 [Contarinia nasturtii]